MTPAAEETQTAPGYKFEPSTVLPLDPSDYILSDDDKSFLKKYIDIQDDEELKTHVLKVQKDAYDVVPYPCIRVCSFIRFIMHKNHAYPKVLQLGKENPQALFLDIGTGLGQELRRLTYDGYPVRSIVATDLQHDLWNAGHQLFKSNEDTFPVKFVRGDIFKLAKGDVEPLQPSLASIDSLRPLKGHVSVIHLAMFFHLFDEGHQRKLAEYCASLLAPKKGSIIFGMHMGTPEARSLADGKIYTHSPESWKKMWDEIFGEGIVECETMLEPVDDIPEAKERFSTYWNPDNFIRWSVERLK